MKKFIEATAAVSSSEHLHQHKQHLHKWQDTNPKLPQRNLLGHNLENHQHSHQGQQLHSSHQHEQQHLYQYQYQKLKQGYISLGYINKSKVCSQIKHVAYISLSYLWLIMLLLLLNLIPSSNADWLLDCGDCTCKWNSGKKTANCNNLSLTAIPENLSPEVQVLDLSFNRISYLEQNAFLNAELHNLQKLYIRNSSLQQIDPRTFTQLEILIEIDLSNNLLRFLKANLFARAIKLRYLVLNGNLLESLGDGVFQNLKYLHKIELQNNRLKQISVQAFIDLPLLSHIYLDGNRLGILRKESFENLQRLNALSLDQNPWNCTCELQIFRDYVIKHNLYTPPTSCYYPQKLRGMLWIEDQPEAFACKPKIIFPLKSASITTSKENVTLTCRILTSANTQINWDFNKKIFRSNTAHGERFQIQLFKDDEAKEKDFGREVFISRMTIFNANQHDDEGIYSCLAENAAGKDTIQLSLLIQNPNEANDFLSHGNLLLVICLMALCLVGVSILMAMITFCIYKRFKANNSGSNVVGSGGGVQALNLSQQSTPNVDPSHTQVFCGNEVSLCVNSESNQKLVKTTNQQIFKNQQPYHLQQQQQQQHHHSQPLQQEHHQLDQQTIQQQQNGTNMDDFKLKVAKDGNNMISNIGKESFDSHSFHQHYGNSNENQRGGHAENLNFEENSQGKLQNSSAREPSLKQGKDDKKTEFQPDLVLSQTNSLKSSPLKGDVSNGEALKNQLAPRNKYNTKVQEYLLAKYGTVKGKSQTKNNNKKISDNVAKREAPSIPLTSSSLSAATGYKNTTSSLETEAISTPTTTETLTLQRHAKSLGLPQQNRQLSSPTSLTLASGATSNALASMKASSTSTTPTPTEFSNPYAYRQPPPPPYNANHRTNKSFSNTKVDINEPVSTLANAARSVGSSKSLGINISRQTLVTTSPSLNFLTTTEAKVPQRHLL